MGIFQQIQKLVRVQTDNRELNQIQEQLHKTVNGLLDHPEVHSLVIKNVQLQAGANDISHNLGRELQGWRIVRQRAAGTVHDNQDSNPNPSKTLTLNASHAMSVDLIVH
jgi:hypothetical protein